MPKIPKLKITLIGFLFLLPSIVGAVSVGETINFYIDPSYDLSKREEISAVLVRITNQIYFYAEKEWWQSLDYLKKQEIEGKLYNLSAEFEHKIYPTLTATFGFEPKPGIDGDEKITVLFHPMSKEAGGYFNSSNLYSKLQYPKSNEREMVYLNSQQIESANLKALLSHEFMHLITANQKELLRGVVEEIWLNEARAEYVPTLLGYNDEYSGSELEKRVKVFLENPNDSLTEWQNKKNDYGVINLFIHYLVDHYGVKILADSLQSSKIGIASINEALAKNGFKEDFSQIFTDWLIAVVVGDCSLSPKYCYLNNNLKNLKIVPTTQLIPLGTESIFSFFNNTKEWAGNWQKIIGGKENLKLEFDGTDETIFKVPYLVCDSQEKCQVNFLNLDKNQKGEVSFSEFNKKYSSLTIIPSVQNKISGFENPEPSFSFSWKVSSYGNNSGKNTEPVKTEPSNPSSSAYKGIPPGFKFEKNLYLGQRISDVVYLKIILAAEGCVSGLANTNYFGPQTLAGVKCFQKKYRAEISAAAGYQIAVTGFVGSGTRVKLNKLLGF